MSDYRARAAGEGSEPASLERVWVADDLWHGFPPEFTGALLSDALRAKLNQAGPLTSFALIGPPGTGKTRSLWGMRHSLRRGTMKSLIGQPIEQLRVADGSYDFKTESYQEAIARILTDHDRMDIITEVGDIRAQRYDRGALQGWIDYPHWLAVDDVGCIEPNEWVREAIYHLANERRSQGRPTVWTSNLTRQQFRDMFGGAIASRILGGEVVEIEGKDRRLT